MPTGEGLDEFGRTIRPDDDSKTEDRSEDGGVGGGGDTRKRKLEETQGGGDGETEEDIDIDVDDEDDDVEKAPQAKIARAANSLDATYTSANVQSMGTTNPSVPVQEQKDPIASFDWIAFDFNDPHSWERLGEAFVASNGFMGDPQTLMALAMQGKGMGMMGVGMGMSMQAGTDGGGAGTGEGEF